MPFVVASVTKKELPVLAFLGCRQIVVPDSNIRGPLFKSAGSVEDGCGFYERHEIFAVRTLRDC
jgi:hypothetical protein